MNYLILPSGGSYQTQQKLKKQKDEQKLKKQREEHKRKKEAKTNEQKPKKERAPSIISNLSDSSSIILPINSQSTSGSFQGTLSNSISEDEKRGEYNRASTIATHDFFFSGGVEISQGGVLHDENTSVDTEHTDKLASSNRNRTPHNFTSRLSSTQTFNPDSGKRPKSKLSSSITIIDAKNIPSFQFISTLKVMNSPSGIKESFYSPAYQLFRFNNFLDVIQAQQSSDLVAFANMRLHALFQFLKSMKLSNQMVREAGPEKNFKSAHALFFFVCQLRSYLQEQIPKYSKSNSRKIEGNYELVSLNFDNYINYLVNLPDESLLWLDELNEVQAEHYKHKRILNKIGDLLLEEEKQKAGFLTSSRFKQLSILEACALHTQNYLLLELYAIQAIMKLRGNYLLKYNTRLSVFEKAKRLILSNSRTPVVILNINCLFSAQYSCIMALTNPFAQVYEIDLKVNDEYSPEECEQPENVFNIPNQNEFFSKMKVEDFDQFTLLPISKLVEFSRSNSSTSRSENTTKPSNFEYWKGTLSTIPSESIDVIHCQDMSFHLTTRNYKEVIREFYRILTKGGKVDCHMFLFQPQIAAPEAREVSSELLSNRILPLGLVADEMYELLPDAPRKLLNEFGEVFGVDSVRYGMVVFNTFNDINRFLEQFIYMKMFDLCRQFDRYFDNLDVENLLGPSQNVNYNFQLTVTKH